MQRSLKPHRFIKASKLNHHSPHEESAATGKNPLEQRYNDEHLLITLPTSSLQHPTNQLLEKAIHTDDA